MNDVARATAISFVAIVIAAAIAACGPPGEARDPEVVGVIERLEPSPTHVGRTAVLSNGIRWDFQSIDEITMQGAAPGDLALAGELNGKRWIAFLAPTSGGSGCWVHYGPSWITDGHMHFQDTLRLPLAEDYNPGRAGDIKRFDGLSRFCITANGEVSAFLNQ